jgi:hypothetical protein
MGQAKQRGSFQDRKALALEKNAVLAERLRVDAYLDDLCRIREKRLRHKKDLPPLKPKISRRGLVFLSIAEAAFMALASADHS